MRMQRAAAATMPTTMPVVLLLSRTTSDGPGNTLTSGRGGPAAGGGGVVWGGETGEEKWALGSLLIWSTCDGGGWRAGRHDASSWWIIGRAFLHNGVLAGVICSFEPKLFTYHLIMDYTSVLRGGSEQRHSYYFWHIMMNAGGDQIKRCLVQ